MKAFTLVLLVLCTIQISTAIPRPDFGVNVPVYGGANVAVTAKEGNTLIDKVNDNLDVLLNSGYPLLTTIKTQLIGIANDFTTKGLAVTGAIDTLATSTGPLDDAFTAFTTASNDLMLLANSGLAPYYTVLEAKLDTSITTMLRDAITDVTTELTKLGGLLDSLKLQLKSAVTAAGSNAPSKTILRKYVSTTLTSNIGKSVISLKALIPLVTYIVANSIENLKVADDYIIDAGKVATNSLDTTNKGLEALEAEIQQYSDDTSQITAIIAPVAQANLDMSSVDMSGISSISSEMNEYKATYTTELDNTIIAIKALYDTYKTAVPLVSDGLSTFLSDKVGDHLHRLVFVLISNGKYADYCYSKYASRALALFDEQAREANRCVDLEITRLLKLQEILLAITKLLVFNIEDLLAEITICAKSSALCDVDSVELAFHKIHLSALAHQTSMKNIVKAETVAGLQRVSACFSTSRYLLVIASNNMIPEINSCATDGPNAP
uniref:Protein TsetseEP domain-containing protein n=1 Tax=Anopheles maculatus TaxID=74869 RepID=A0A182TB56_9DIPT